jgi:hypothetical protein
MAYSLNKQLVGRERKEEFLKLILPAIAALAATTLGSSSIACNRTDPYPVTGDHELLKKVQDNLFVCEVGGEPAAVKLDEYAVDLCVDSPNDFRLSIGSKAAMVSSFSSTDQSLNSFIISSYATVDSTGLPSELNCAFVKIPRPSPKE